MWYNPIVTFVLKSPFHGYFSKSTLLIETEGRNTGKRYTIPVTYAHDKDDLLVLSLKRRTWWKNLQNVRPFAIRLRGRRYPATAEVFTDPEDIVRELAIYLREMQWLAKHIDIQMDNDNKPVLADLTKAAEKRVMIRIHHQ